jgi:hypothetical protein
MSSFTAPITSQLVLLQQHVINNACQLCSVTVKDIAFQFALKAYIGSALKRLEYG